MTYVHNDLPTDAIPFGSVHYELSQHGFEPYWSDCPYSIAGPMSWPALNVFTLMGDTVYIAHYPAPSAEDAEGVARFLHAVSNGHPPAPGQGIGIRLAPYAVAAFLLHTVKEDGLLLLRRAYSGRITLIWAPDRDPHAVAVTALDPDTVLHNDYSDYSRIPTQIELVPEYAESPAKRKSRCRRAARMAREICRGLTSSPVVQASDAPEPGDRGETAR